MAVNPDATGDNDMGAVGHRTGRPANDQRNDSGFRNHCGGRYSTIFGNAADTGTDDSADAPAGYCHDDDLIHSYHRGVRHLAAGAGASTDTLQSDPVRSGTVLVDIHHDAGTAADEHDGAAAL